MNYFKRTSINEGYPLDKTIVNADISAKFFDVFKTFETGEPFLTSKVRPYVINSFEEIGWPDPFPDKIVKCMELDPMIPVYQKERLTGPNSPPCIYLPNDELFMKMLRACINVKFIEELWINNKEK